jgi:hypothetical protein
MTKLSNRGDLIVQRLFECIHNGELETTHLVQIFEFIGNDYLNCRTLSNWARENGKSYNGAKLQKNKVFIDGVTLVI